MDFLEKTFGRFWKTERQKIATKSTVIFVQDIKKYLQTITDFLLENDKSIEISGSLYGVGFYNDTLLLPDQIGFFDQQEQNKKAYTYLTLLSCALRGLKLKTTNESHSKVADRLLTLQHLSAVNCWLDKRLPGFINFQTDYLKSIRLKNRTDDKIARFVFSQILSRSQRDFELQSENWQKLLKSTKRNDSLRPFIHYLIPKLSIENTLSSHVAAVGEQKLNNEQITTEMKRKRNEAFKKSTFGDKKEEVNPIIHSFEKMETVDDYEGGRRFDSGDDDLADHQAGLDEVELSQVTVSGEISKSLYRHDSDLVISREDDESYIHPLDKRLYPEWDSKKQKYLKNHCQVFISVANFEKVNLDRKFKIEWISKHKRNVVNYKSKIEQLFNEPLWIKKLKEGSEIDLDAHLRAYIDMKSSHSADDKIYTDKRKMQQDVAVLFLFDQSLSSDSWIADKRILDIILECIGLCGVVFEDIISRVMVAGAASATRHHIDFFIYKEFKQSWDYFFNIVPFIKAQGYTRFGPAIRHATDILEKVQAKKKIMILLTDGKPTDLDKYEGTRGINDIRKAVLEAEQKGFYIMALTIDQESKAHFVKMFPKFALLSKPEQLFEELFKLLTKALK